MLRENPLDSSGFYFMGLAQTFMDHKSRSHDKVAILIDTVTVLKMYSSFHSRYRDFPHL